MARALLKSHTSLDEVCVVVGFLQLFEHRLPGAAVIDALRRLCPGLPLDAENFDFDSESLVLVLQLLEDGLVVAVGTFDRGTVSKKERCDEEDKNPELFHLILLDRVCFHYNRCYNCEKVYW